MKEATHIKSKSRRSHSRLQAVLDAAAQRFATKGYKATTMRDIATEAGMLPGSLYHYFKSKQDMLLEIYQRAVNGIQTDVDEAVSAKSLPWDRFEAGVIRHIETVLDQTNYAKVMISVLPTDAPEIEKELAALRDRYEKSFAGLIEALPLAADIDRKKLRLIVLGAMNSTQHWYRPGTYSPGEVAQALLTVLKEPLASDLTRPKDS